MYELWSVWPQKLAVSREASGDEQHCMFCLWWSWPYCQRLCAKKTWRWLILSQGFDFSVTFLRYTLILNSTKFWTSIAKTKQDWRRVHVSNGRVRRGTSPSSTWNYWWSTQLAAEFWTRFVQQQTWCSKVTWTFKCAKQLFKNWRIFCQSINWTSWIWWIQWKRAKKLE